MAKIEQSLENIVEELRRLNAASDKKADIKDALDKIKYASELLKSMESYSVIYAANHTLMDVIKQLEKE